MTGIHDPGWFILSGLLLNLTPGADTVFILGRSAVHGMRAGLLAALGIAAGCAVQVLAAASGLSAMLLGAPRIYAGIRFAGALYLMYLGLGLVRQPWRATPAPAAPARRTAFAQGLLTNLLNPKVALFFLAFLPQFVDPAAPAATCGMLLLGATFIATGTAWNACLAWTGTRVARTTALRGSRLGRALQLGAGCVLLGIGGWLALAT